MSPRVGVPGPALEYGPCPGWNLLHQLERDTGKTLVLVPGESRDSQGVTELVPGVVCTLCQGDLPEEARAAGGY